jgi:hypothetical protein
MSRDRNDGQLTPLEKYVIVRSNDYYATRLSSGGEIDIFDFDTHFIKFFMFAAVGNP